MGEPGSHFVAERRSMRGDLEKWEGKGDIVIGNLRRGELRYCKGTCLSAAEFVMMNEGKLADLNH